MRRAGARFPLSARRLAQPMAREVLITGATGTLGHRVVGEATEAGHNVRALSRKSHVGYTGVHWAQGDLLSGDGIDAALDGIDTVIHCATQGTRGKDVVSANNLISAARRAGRHQHHLCVDRRHRSHPAAVLQGQAPRRGSVGRVRAGPHDHPRHAVPRPDRDDVLDPAILACSICDQGRALPADRHPRRRDPPGVAHRQRRQRVASTTSAGPPSTTTTNSGGCISLTQQPPTCAGSSRARQHRRRLEVGGQPGAGKPSRDDRLRRAPGANSMTFLCLFAASS